MRDFRVARLCLVLLLGSCTEVSPFRGIQRTKFSITRVSLLQNNILRLWGGLDAQPAFDDSLSYGSSEVDEIEKLMAQDYAGDLNERASALQRIQNQLLKKIQGTPGLGPPPPGLLVGDPEQEAEVLPYGVAGPRRTWNEVRELDGDTEDGIRVQENKTLSEHTHPYRYRAGYDTTPPGNTLYIRNLRERVGTARMRQLLYAVFSKFGTLLDVVMIRTKKMRGQAFVCFQELHNAVRAKEELDGFSFLNRTLVIQYARTQSHALHKAQGSFQQLVQQRREEFREKEAREEAEQTDQQEARMKEVAQTAVRAMRSGEARGSLAGLHALGLMRTEEPSPLLLIDKVPPGVARQDLADVFGQFDGFLKLESLPTLEATFLAEYEDQDTASESKQALHGFSYPEDPDRPIAVGFAYAADYNAMWTAIEREASAKAQDQAPDRA